MPRALPSTAGLGLPCHSGKYLPCIAPVDAMVIDFGVHNQVGVVALWISLSELAFKWHETDPLISSSKQQAA